MEAAEYAARRHGIVSDEELRRFGITRNQRERLVASGMLVVVFRGVYRIRSTPETFDGFCRAISLAASAAVITGRAGGRLWGLRLMGRDSRVEVRAPHYCNSLSDDRILLRRCNVMDAVDVVERDDGIRVVSPPRLAFDLAAGLSPLELESVIEQILDRGWCTVQTFVDMGRRLYHPARPGSVAFATVMGEPDRPRHVARRKGRLRTRQAERPAVGDDRLARRPRHGRGHRSAPRRHRRGTARHLAPPPDVRELQPSLCRLTFTDGGAGVCGRATKGGDAYGSPARRSGPGGVAQQVCQKPLKLFTDRADSEDMAVRPLTLDSEILGLQDDLATAWSARFGPAYAGATVPPAVVRELLVALTTGDTAELGDAAQALGVLRAHEGRQASALVEDLLALRAALWGRLSVSSAIADDAGALVMLHQRSTEIVDGALRAAVESFVSESHRVLSRKATRDPLTGLLNRAAFDEALSRELAARGQVPTVLVVDLDGFKQVNDRLGHLVGDAVLTSVAALLIDVCRGGDIVGRLGGDEFAIILPETSGADAERVAARLITAAQRSAELGPEGAERVSMSIGLACLPRPASVEQVLHAADEAMYTAKRSGGSAFVSAAPGRAC